MPVKKTAAKKAAAPAPPPQFTFMNAFCGKDPNSFSCQFARSLLVTLIGILLAYLIVFVGTLIRNNIQQHNYIGHADKHERTISVSATGKVSVRSDIAMTTMGVVSEGPTVGEAQQQNSAVMSRLTARLAALGVADDDVQTVQYNIYPQYRYSEDEGRTLTGYEVTQQLSVKIRNLERANDVLALAGQVGANNVSGLDFTVDDKDAYLAEARAMALDKVEEKARQLARMLGVRVVGVVSYNENVGGGNDHAYPRYAALEAGYGGGPSLESGSEDVTLTAHVTFEVR